MLDLKIDSHKSGLSNFSNPFEKDCVQNIFFHIRKDFNGHFQLNASVEFICNNTEGKQRFSSDDFGELVKEVEKFIQQL